MMLLCIHIFEIEKEHTEQYSDARVYHYILKCKKCGKMKMKEFTIWGCRGIRE